MKKKHNKKKDLASKSIGELATHHPELINVFESLNMDYCCNGKNNLLEAIEKSNLGLKKVISIIEKTIKNTNNNSKLDALSNLSLTELVDYIESTHHTYVRNQLPLLTQFFEKILHVHNKHHGTMIQSAQKVFFELNSEVEEHLKKEEQILFPYIKQMEKGMKKNSTVPPMHCGTVQHPIHQMHHEHEETGKALGQLHAITNNYTTPENTCESFQALFKGLQELELDFHRHIHIENNILFPKTITLEQKIFINKN